MTSDDSVTTWLSGVKDGSDTAIPRIWDYVRLVGLTRRILQDSPQHSGEEEDIAASAFESFYFRATACELPRLEDRDDLWKLLMTITVRKAFMLKRKKKRRPPHERLEFVDESLASAEPTLEIAALVASEFDRLLRLLNDESLRTVALAKMEGCTNKEIAQRVDRSLSFVERKLHLIRRIWSDEITPESTPSSPDPRVPSV